MSPAEPQVVEQPGREFAASYPAGASTLRRSAAIRVVLAVGIAAGLTAILIVGLWGSLPAKSDVMGYPIFADYDASNYPHAYYLTIAFFPIAALLIFLGLTRIGPRVGLVAPPPRGALLRAPAGALETDPAPAPDPGGSIKLQVAAGVRVALTGAFLGLAIGIGLDHLWWDVLLTSIGYSLLVALVSAALGRLMPVAWTVAARLATVNALGASLSLIGLSIVSAHTVVHVLSNGSVHHYPWFPLWLGVPLAAVLFVWVLVSLRRGGAAHTVVIERRAVLLVAAPVALFVLVARLQGDSGPLSLYEVGQLLTSTRLMLDGYLPWSDFVTAHGLLRDVVPTAVGWGVFGNSYWGGQAGYAIILLPLTIVTTFWLLVYIAGRNWPVLIIGGLLWTGTWLGVTDSRFLLWPLVLLLLAALLKRRTRTRGVALGALMVVQGILTPEMAAAVPVVAVALVAYEFYWRAPGVPWRRVFQRTIWFAVGLVAIGVAFAIYMASQGALGDVISVTLDLLAGHFSLGIPPTLGVSPQAIFDFIALAPVAAVLISIAYAVVMVRTRRAFQLADWPMGVVAVYTLFYYTKFLTRMDSGHVYQPLMVSLPLMVYIVCRALSALDQAIRNQVPEMRAGWLPSYPVGLAALICFGALFWGPLHRTVQAAPAAFRPTAPKPSIPGVGYAVDYQPTVVNDLRKVVDAYLGPHDRLMDITDEPGMFYYFLSRVPASRWGVAGPGGGLIDTTTLQHLLIDDLRRERPKLLVYDNVATPDRMFGLAALDGMPNPETFYLVSRWILRHYRPLLASHGRTIYALPSVHRIPSSRLHLRQRPVTNGLQFTGQSCLWGDAPDFLDGAGQPRPGTTSVPARIVSLHGPTVAFTGWAADRHSSRPAREVVATLDGRVIARTKPSIARPDVVKAGYPASFLHSGYQLSIPFSAIPSGLRVFSIDQDGSAAQLSINGEKVQQRGRTRLAGRSFTLAPQVDVGGVDSAVPRAGYAEIAPPAGSSWADYDWLEIDAPSTGFTPGASTLADIPGPAVPTNYGHFMAFSTVKAERNRYTIPAASCPQWRGWGSRTLYLSSPAEQATPGVRLVR